MGSCLSIHPSRRGPFRPKTMRSSSKKDPLPVLLPADVEYVLNKVKKVEDRMQAEIQTHGKTSWKYCVLLEIYETYHEILRVGEQPFDQNRNMEKDNLGAKVDILEDRLRGIW